MRQTNTDKETEKPDIINNDQAIKEMAEQLNTIAKRKFDDGTLVGSLRGHESEIRQDAVLKALAWYKKFLSCNSAEDSELWCPEKSFNYACKWVILDHLRIISKRMPSIDDPEYMGLVCYYGSDQAKAEYNISQIAEILRRAVKQALRSNYITPTNAIIALMIIDQGKSVQCIAKELGISRSGIYQQLKKLREALRTILEKIEYPSIDEVTR